MIDNKQDFVSHLFDCIQRLDVLINNVSDDDEFNQWVDDVVKPIGQAFSNARRLIAFYNPNRQ